MRRNFEFILVQAFLFSRVCRALGTAISVLTPITRRTLDQSYSARFLETINLALAVFADHFCLRQVISTCTGISFFTGSASKDGGSILKSESVAGMVPDIRASSPW